MQCSNCGKCCEKTEMELSRNGAKKLAFPLKCFLRIVGKHSRYYSIELGKNLRLEKALSKQGEKAGEKSGEKSLLKWLENNIGKYSQNHLLSSGIKLGR